MFKPQVKFLSDYEMVILLNVNDKIVIDFTEGSLLRATIKNYQFISALVMAVAFEVFAQECRCRT